jgi:BirA family biotin operon repressor/biotin-[acetyl-CoA-carboxylase] ligase
MFEPLPDDLAAALGAAATRLGPYARMRYAAEVESTNTLALALAATGAPEGTSVVADAQTAGRGRRGRDWFSPPGAGLYLSVIVRPDVAAEIVPMITLAAGVAVAGAVQEAVGLPVELKWPNDLVIGRPWRKLGGVLSEAASSGTGVDAVVIGIGLNLLQASYPAGLAGRASSIEAELGRPIERAALAVALLERLRAVLGRMHAEGREAICREWRTFGGAGLTGATVQWDDRAGRRRGRAIDIGADGALLVECDGRVERVMAGDVVWES